MEGSVRRQQILEHLQQNTRPVSASTLARSFHVSRQLIVGDIALLRASGIEIEATPRGYVLPSANVAKEEIRKLIACRHTSEQTRDELYTIVDNGCIVQDVIVEHPIYGQLIGSLALRSRYDVDCFLERIRQTEAIPLSFLTEGIHLHTLLCPNEDASDRVLSALQKLGILLPDNE